MNFSERKFCKNKEFLSRKEIIFSAVEALVGARGCSFIIKKHYYIKYSAL
jgi:hypothetical protein